MKWFFLYRNGLSVEKQKKVLKNYFSSFFFFSVADRDDGDEMSKRDKTYTITYLGKQKLRNFA